MAENKVVNKKTQKELPTKYKRHIKLAMNYYDNKQYRKGIKECHTVLKEFPKNGEATCVKGLIMLASGKREEGSQIVKNGLRLNVRSFTCWQIFAIMNRLNNDYDTAISGFNNAHRIMPTHFQVLRDLTVMQLQTNNTVKFLENARKLLILQPNNKVNWIACIIGTYLNGAKNETLEIISAYQSTLDETKQNDYETSELHLFIAKVIRESSGTKEMISYIEKNKKEIIDKRFVAWNKVESLLELGKKTFAAKYAKELVEKDINDFKAHSLFCRAFDFHIEKALGDKKSANLVLKTSYDEWIEKNPNNLLLNSIQLQISQGEHFENALKSFFDHLKPGKKNFIKVLNSVLCDPAKRKIVKEILKKRLQNAIEKCSVNKESEEKTTQNEKELQSATKAVIHLMEQKGKFEKVLGLIEKVMKLARGEDIRREMFNYKGHVFKKLGKLNDSFEFYEKARQMNLKDRLANVKSVKAAIRLNRTKEALEILYLFIEEKNQNLDYLRKTQYLWLFKAMGDNYFVQKEYKKSLECYSAIIQYYEDISRDMLDFHLYSFSRTTLRIYCEMRDFVKQRFTEDIFVKSAINSIKCHLKLNESESDQSHLTSATKLIRNMEISGVQRGDLNDLSLQIYKLRDKKYLVERYEAKSSLKRLN